MVLVAASLTVILGLTLIPSPGAERRAPSLCVICGDNGGEDFVLNVLLFMPYGFALRLARMRRKYVVAIVVATTLLIEGLQATVIAGRNASVGDVISNTLGGVFGLVLAEWWRPLLAPNRQQARHLTVVSALAWWSQLALGSVLVRPSLTPAPYWGEWAPGEHENDRFDGKILDVRWGDRLLVNDGTGDPMTYAPAYSRALLSGAPTVVRLVPGPPTKDRVPLVRVVDLHEEEILLIAQHGRDLLFGVRTHARDFGMRAPLLSVENGFPSQAGMQEITISAQLTADQLIARVQYGRDARARHLSLRSTLWWTAVMPVDYPLNEESAPLLNGAFAGLLLMPLTYWAVSAAPALVSIVIVALVGAIGVAGIPIATGVAPASLAESSVIAVIAATSMGVGWLAHRRGSMLSPGRGSSRRGNFEG